MRVFFLLTVLLVAGCAVSSKHDSTHRAPVVIPTDDHGRAVGCSWYCGAPPITVTASKTLRDGIFSYEPANVHDWKKDTVWAVGDAQHGIGTKLRFTFDCTGRSYQRDNPLGIHGFSLINGFARNPRLWASNSRAKALKITFNGRDYGSVTVADTIEPQTVRLPKLTLVPGKKNHLVFELADVYPGETRDTCIADIVFDGFGVH